MSTTFRLGLHVTPISVHWHCSCGANAHSKPASNVLILAAMKQMQHHAENCSHLTFDERGIYDTYREALA